MSSSFSLAVVLYALGLAAVCAVIAVRGAARGPLLLPALAMVEIVVIIQAALDLTRLARGAHPAELATHVGYLIASIVIVPVAAGAIRLDEGPWGSAALAIGCLVVAVVSIRLHQTLGPHRG